MPTTIKFDTTEIATTTYNPQFIKHESNPERILTTLQLAREDGEILIADRWGIKKIQLKGILVGTSQADLESKINTFKELFSRQEKNLDIDWNGGTLRYVATCSKHEFDRDHFHILFVPWTAEFTIVSGEGKDTSTTKALNEHAPSGSNPYTDSFTLDGSKPGKPVITVAPNAYWPSSDIKGIEYKNTDTGEKMQITYATSYLSTAAFVINCLLKKVLVNSVEQKFYGIFPKFKIGTNNISIKLGGLVNQSSGDESIGLIGTSRLLNNTNTKISQSFSVPYTDTTFQGIILALVKTNSPGNITVRIETDNGNKPSGTLVDANATFTIAAGDVGGSNAYITKYSTNAFTLQANTKYWIVISAASVDGSNYYEVGAYSASTYTKGNAKYSTDGGSTWNDETIANIYSFKILYGGVAATQTLKHTVEYTKTYL